MIDILVLVPKIVLINDNVALQGLLQITWIYSINLFRNIGILWFAYWISALLNGAILREQSDKIWLKIKTLHTGMFNPFNFQVYDNCLAIVYGIWEKGNG